MIKSYRGLIADGGQDTIPLHTPDGKTGYKIVKFEIMPENAGTTNYEHTVQIFKIKQDTVVANVNFSDGTLIAAAYTEGNASANYIGQPLITIFDFEIFNQDIYVTHVDSSGTDVNYYIELEQIKLSEQEALVSIVKNLRNEQ